MYFKEVMTLLVQYHKQNKSGTIVNLNLFHQYNTTQFVCLIYNIHVLTA